MKRERRALWGLMAVFETAEELISAVEATHSHGFKKYDAYSPFPLEEVAVAMEIRHTGIAPICWIGGFVGASSGFGYLCWTTIVRFPLNVGGRPYFSWPAYIPITFELMILFAGVCTFLAVLGLSGLPRFYHPTFNIDEFQKRNSTDGFFLVIESEDRLFELTETRDFLNSLKPARLYEVPDVP